jgi:hypothetical protein
MKAAATPQTTAAAEGAREPASATAAASTTATESAREAAATAVEAATSAAAETAATPAVETTPAATAMEATAATPAVKAAATAPAAAWRRSGRRRADRGDRRPAHQGGQAGAKCLAHRNRTLLRPRPHRNVRRAARLPHPERPSCVKRAAPLLRKPRGCRPHAPGMRRGNAREPGSVKIRIVHVGAGIALAGLATLAACNPSGGVSGDTHLALTGSKYCTPFPATSASNSTAGLSQTPDPATAFDDCVHRWAYALAPARDPADVVAQASVDACGAALNAWSQQAQGQAPPPTNERGAQSQQSTAMAQQMRGAEARALFYVVQARAAGCAPPPANTLSTSPPPT